MTVIAQKETWRRPNRTLGCHFRQFIYNFIHHLKNIVIILREGQSKYSQNKYNFVLHTHIKCIERRRGERERETEGERNRERERERMNVCTPMRMSCSGVSPLLGDRTSSDCAHRKLVRAEAKS